MPALRPVHLPLDTSSKQCFTCGVEAATLRLCASCGEAVYCSRECQRKDWKEHKTHCGDNVRLDLGIFHPFLALLKDIGHWIDIEGICPPPLLRSPILGLSPQPVQLPNGSYARLVVYDGSQTPDFFQCEGESAWWPTAPSLLEASWLYRRIARDGRQSHIPIIVGIALAMLRGIYTTTSGNPSEHWNGKPQQRVRLKYKSSPIADFGIAKGPAAIMAYNRLAYYDTSTKTYSYGQDPDDHYWFYFKTGKGKIINIDCGLGTYGLGLYAHTKGYNQFFDPEPFPGPKFEVSPTLFLEVDFRLHNTIKRCSILRNEGLQKATGNTESGDKQGLIKEIQEFIKELRGVECSRDEAELTNRMACFYNSFFSRMLAEESWNTWPTDAGGCIRGDDPLARDIESPPEYLVKWLTADSHPMDLNQFLEMVLSRCS